jgi:hypothetical protein
VVVISGVVIDGECDWRADTHSSVQNFISMGLDGAGRSALVLVQWWPITN